MRSTKISILIFFLKGPPITSTTNQSISQVNGHPNGSDMATGPYYLATPLLTSYHQQFWVIAQIVTENKDGTQP
jgi:hypothetical protein